MNFMNSSLSQESTKVEACASGGSDPYLIRNEGGAFTEGWEILIGMFSKCTEFLNLKLL